MTAMTGAETDNLGILDPDYLRRMGESEASIAYLTGQRALDPRGLTMDRVVAHMATIPYTAPATDTGD